MIRAAPEINETLQNIQGLHAISYVCCGRSWSPFFALVDVEHDISHLQGRLNADFFFGAKKDVLPEQQNFHLPPSGCVDSGKLCFPRHGRLLEIASMLCFPGKGIAVFHAIPAAPASLSR